MTSDEWKKRIAANTLEQRMLRDAVSSRWFTVPREGGPPVVTMISITVDPENWRIRLHMGSHFSSVKDPGYERFGLGLSGSDPLDQLRPRDCRLYADVRTELSRWELGERDAFPTAAEFGLVDKTPPPLVAEV